MSHLKDVVHYLSYLYKDFCLPLLSFTFHRAFTSHQYSMQHSSRFGLRNSRNMYYHVFNDKSVRLQDSFFINLHYRDISFLN